MPFQSKYDTTDVTKSTADKIKELTPTKNYALPNHIMYAALIRKMREPGNKPFLWDCPEEIAPNTKVNFVYGDNVIYGERTSKLATRNPDIVGAWDNEIVLTKTGKRPKSQEKELSKEEIERLIESRK